MNKEGGKEGEEESKRGRTYSKKMGEEKEE